MEGKLLEWFATGPLNKITHPVVLYTVLAAETALLCLLTHSSRQSPFILSPWHILSSHQQVDVDRE